MKQLYKFTKEDWYGLAVIIDNSFIGSLDTFSHDRSFGFNTLNTEKCDDASIIKVYSKDLTCITKITRLGEDTEGWQEIHKETFEKVLNYIKTL